MPEQIAPNRPLLRIIISAGAKDKTLSLKAPKEAAGAVKYSINFTLSIININTIGLKIAIIHDILSNIFNKKPIPKNKTKNNNIDISKTGKLISIPNHLQYIILKCTE
jgi:hypothetical protein